MRYLRTISIALISSLTACTSAPKPSAFLFGTWADARNHFEIAHDGGVFTTFAGAAGTTPCVRVTLPPIRLDDSLAFQVTGQATVFGDSSADGERPRNYTINGRFVGDTLVMLDTWISPTPKDDRLVRTKEKAGSCGTEAAN